MDHDINPIKVKTEYTFDEHKEYSMFSMFKGKRYYLSKKLFFIGYPILIVFITLSTIFFWPDYLLVVSDAALISIYIFITYMAKYYPKRSYKKVKKLFSSGMFFEFYNSYFTVKQSNNLYSGEGKINYEALFKIYETKSMIYIYIDRNQAYMINKDNIDANKLDNLRSMIVKGIGKKNFVITN